MNSLKTLLATAIDFMDKTLSGRLLVLLLAGAGFGLITLIAANSNETLPPPAGVPIGTIVAFAGPTNAVPEDQGWLLCDGRELSISQNLSLFHAIGYAWGKGQKSGFFRAPDLRGRFLRGVNLQIEGGDRDLDKDNRQADYPGGNTGNRIGSIQQDQVKQHQHLLLGSPWAVGMGDQGINQLVRFYDTKSPDETAAEYANPIPVLAEGGSESRPKNAYVNWIIKAK